MQLFRFKLEIIIQYQESKLKFDKRKEIQEEDLRKRSNNQKRERKKEKETKRKKKIQGKRERFRNNKINKKNLLIQWW